MSLKVIRASTMVIVEAQTPLSQPMPRILVSWIGHADLRAMASQLPEKARDAVLRHVGGDHSPRRGLKGPVRTLLDSVYFDQVHLLSNYDAAVSKDFRKWLGRPATVHLTKLKDPTDYGAIFVAVDAVMGEIAADRALEHASLCILLSPGTPAMAAVWVLLGKTKYPATFYQTWDDDAWESEIPFDLTIDVVPELLRNPDSHLQHLASQSPQEIPGFEGIVGDSKAIRLAVGRAKKAALRDVPVLVTGETGSGKEMFARAIHAASHRRSQPFLAVNCAAIPAALLESQLFGHEKGAFTGADRKHEGAFQRADGGTIFLDEVGECDLDLQAKLLRVLQPPPGTAPCCREFSPVGSSKPVRTDTRVIAATNRDLPALVQDGRFREDLLYRLAVITIKIPPLRERRADIQKIAEGLLEAINRDFEKQEPGYKHKHICDSANSFVSRYDWPGNVRQLYNALLQAAVMTDSDEIAADDLRAAVSESPVGVSRREDALEVPLGDGFSLESHLETIQRHYLRRALIESNGVKARAARLLGMKNYQTLDAQIRRLGVEMP